MIYWHCWERPTQSTAQLWKRWFFTNTNQKTVVFHWSPLNTLSNHLLPHCSCKSIWLCLYHFFTSKNFDFCPIFVWRPSAKSNFNLLSEWAYIQTSRFYIISFLALYSTAHLLTSFPAEKSISAAWCSHHHVKGLFRILSFLKHILHIGQKV